MENGVEGVEVCESVGARVGVDGEDRGGDGGEEERPKAGKEEEGVEGVPVTVGEAGAVAEGVDGLDGLQFMLLTALCTDAAPLEEDEDASSAIASDMKTAAERCWQEQRSTVAASQGLTDTQRREESSRRSRLWLRVDSQACRRKMEAGVQRG